MKLTTLFCDLDDTLYPPDSGVWEAIAGRINLYLHDRVGLSWERLAEVRERYFREYGTTLRGLQINHQVDPEDYLAFVHDVPLERFLRPDPNLRRAFEHLPLRKYIFTNADCAHAARVTKMLGLDGVFDGCIDVHVIAPYCKPMPEAFGLALKAAGNPDPRSCVMIDDQPRITRAARALGFVTILAGRADPGEDADLALPFLTDLPERLANF
jgi:putative hydrolase of the HAD superfamily